MGIAARIVAAIAVDGVAAFALSGSEPRGGDVTRGPRAVVVTGW
jgi:hypothetical protein